MTATASFFWPRKGDWKASERALFPTLMSLTTKEIVQIWDQVSLHVQRQLALSKSVEIVGLGTFAVHTQELHTGRNDCLLIQRPVFQLSSVIRRIFDLTYAKRIIPGSKLAVPLDYAAIALETSHPRDAVENCVNETVMYLSRCISNGLNVDFVLRDMGVLLIRQKKVRMRFYENFLLSLDGAGNLKEIIISRKKGTMNWVISQGENGVSDVFTEADILFPSLQFKTEHGKFFLKSLRERPTKPLQEKKTKDVFKEEINRKGILSALPHSGPVNVRPVDLKEQRREEIKRRKSPIRRLYEAGGRSCEELDGKTLEAEPRAEPHVPDHYIKATASEELQDAGRNCESSLTAGKK
ncbi:coiled-coil domain-containing protein 81 isoform X2 [Numida meleagris]|uniref:coiled-coil domain-containing protein 81 isoform X2 n=1 Tax=Numida meleagris TaxID=8996 RepID=UPI000B3E0CDD|nr:coiled-coil domain-containing protein 81 isoform X2 [Numida meleagris]